MPYRNLVFCRSFYYHVFNRGANRQLIYFSPDNYLYCLKLLAKNVRRYNVTVIAYCLMPNHYHLLHLCRYIHLNPVKANLESSVFSWPYSNFLEWTGRRQGSLFDESFAKDNFHTPNDYLQFVEDGLTDFENDGMLHPYIFD